MPICSMVLVYLPTNQGDFVRANAGKYSSTIEHMGLLKNMPKWELFNFWVFHICILTSENVD